VADERVRDLGRAAASGDPAARARHLVARVRAGEVSRADLRLGAALGDEAADATLRRLGEEPYTAPNLRAWFLGLPLDRGGRVRACLAAARLALAEWSDPGSDDELATRAAIEASAAWLAGPSAERAAVCADAARDAAATVRPPFSWDDHDLPHAAALFAAAAATAATGPAADAGYVTLADQALVRVAARSGRVRRAVREALLPAALREG